LSPCAAHAAGEHTETESEGTDDDDDDEDEEDEEEGEEEEEGEHDGWGSVDEVTCSEATDEEQSNHDEKEYQEEEDEVQEWDTDNDDDEEEDEKTEGSDNDDDEEEDGKMEGSSSFFTFTGSGAKTSPPGLFKFGANSTHAAQEAASVAAELRAKAAAGSGNMSGTSKSVLSDAERASLLDALARSRKELEEELTKKHMYSKSTPRGTSTSHIYTPSEEAFARASAPCPSTERRPGVSSTTSAGAHSTDIERAAAMRCHAERSQSTSIASSSSTPRGVGETPRAGDVAFGGGKGAKPTTFASATKEPKEAMESAMTVAQRTAEEAKERGNERFQMQRWEAAAREYTSAGRLFQK